MLNETEYPRSYLKFAAKLCSKYLQNKEDSWRPDIEEEERLAIICEKYDYIMCFALSGFPYLKSLFLDVLSKQANVIVSIWICLYFLFSLTTIGLGDINIYDIGGFIVGKSSIFIAVYAFSGAFLYGIRGEIDKRMIIKAAATDYIAGEINLSEFEKAYCFAIKNN